MSIDAVVLILLAPPLLYWFMRLERRGQPEVAAFLLLALLIVEAMIYPSQNEVPGGIFHPNFAGRALRLPDYLIPLALLARVIARGAPRKIGTPALLWAAYFAWYGAGIAVGIYFHHPFDQIFFQSKSLIHIGGAAVLVAGVPASRLASPASIRRFVLILGAMVAAVSPLAVSKHIVALHLPLFPRSVVGLISPDAATILATIGLVALLFEAARKDRLALVAIAATPLLLSPFIATQRAAILGLSAMVIAAALGTIGPNWRRRMRGTPTEGAILVGILLIPVLVTISFRSIWPPSYGAPVVPFADVVVETFTAERKAQSADTRLNLWKEGITQTSEYPVMGWGLGKTYSVERAGQPSKALEGGGFHNVAVDILVRRGAVGLILFVVAVIATISSAFLTWRRHVSRYVAVLSFACASCLIGLLAKGMVESIFEKFRLATLMGLLIGAILSCAGTLRSGGDRDLNEVQEDEDLYVAT